MSILNRDPLDLDLFLKENMEGIEGEVVAYKMPLIVSSLVVFLIVGHANGHANA